MTQTDNAPAPEFQAADRGAQEDLGWFRGLLAKYQNSLSVARASLLWVLLRRQKRTVKWLFAVVIVYSFGLFNILNLTRGMVDNGIVDQTAPLWPYVRYIAFWALWSMVFGFIQQQLAERLSYQIEFDLRVWLYTHIQSAELRRLDAVANGQLVTRSLTDVALVETLLRIFPTLVGFTPLLLAAGVIVIIISPIMGVLTLIALPLNLSLLLRFRLRLRALSWAELNERAEVTGAIDEPVRGIRVVKAFGREEKERARVADVTERAYKFSMSRARLLAGYDVILKMTPILVQAGLLAVGTWMLANGRLSAGTFLIAFQLGTGFNQFASALDDLANAWQYLRGGQDRLAEMLALSARPVTDGRMMPLPSTGFELRDVEVTYGDRRFLHGLELHVRSGELVVVNGPPGSGKSTLAGIASGLMEPDSGAAVLDGVALHDLDPTELRRTIRVVSEEPLLLATSLRDNLLLGAYGEIDDAQLLDALLTAGADEVITEMDGGLDGQIGDRGLTVSGGQRQRISLARALVARPRVLILDDALSAVNPALEIEIMRRVRAYLPDTSILYITRRTGLVALADRTVTLAAPTSAPPNTDPGSGTIPGVGARRFAGRDRRGRSRLADVRGVARRRSHDGARSRRAYRHGGRGRRRHRAAPGHLRVGRDRSGAGEVGWFARRQPREARHPRRARRRRQPSDLLVAGAAVPAGDVHRTRPRGDRRTRPDRAEPRLRLRHRIRHQRRYQDRVRERHRPRHHRRPGRRVLDALPDLRATIQPERGLSAPPTSVLPLEQARRELLRP